MTIVFIDRERALRLARTVSSWHDADDMAGALDCFSGMVRGNFSDAEITAIFREANEAARHDE